MGLIVSGNISSRNTGLLYSDLAYRENNLADLNIYHEDPYTQLNLTTQIFIPFSIEVDSHSRVFICSLILSYMFIA